LANFNRRTVILLLLTIVVISVCLRYPLVDHERHNDTFAMRLLAESITERGYAVWTFHPLSYFGYYPISYPSGTPFLLAEISEMTGLGLSLTIALFGAIIGTLYTLAVFCMSRLLIRRVDVSILATFFAMLAPRFVDTSYFSGSARAPFVAMAVFAVFVAFKTGSLGRPTLIAILGLAVIGCFALHHMAVVLILFALAYMLSTLVERVSLALSLKRAHGDTRKMFAGSATAAIGIVVILAAVLYLGYFEQKLSLDYGSTSLFSFEPVYLSVLLNLAASYTNQIGLLLPIAVLGLPVYFLRTRLSTATLFPVFLIISFVPLLPNALYITMVIAPFVAILGAAWFGIALKRRRGRRLVLLLLSAMIVTSLILPVWSSDRWNGIKETSGDTVASDLQLFSDASYLRCFRGDVYAVSNNDVLSARLSGASGLIFLRSGVISALSGDVTAESVKGNLSWMKERFPENLYLWFQYEDEHDINTYLIRYVVQGNQFPAGAGDSWQAEEDFYERHSRLLVAVDNGWPSSYIWVWAVLPAKLPSELLNAQWTVGSAKFPLNSYSLYASGRITLFATEVPNRYA